MFRTGVGKKRLVGVVLLATILALFILFNRFPKLDIVGEDLDAVTAPVAQCFQGFCIEREPGTSFFTKWTTFSVTYLRLVTVGMTFAFLVAGLAEAFLFPPESSRGFSSGSVFKRTLQGAAAGPVMNLCSACIVPVSSAFYRRAGLEGAIAMVQGSATMNIPALAMVFFVFTPLLGFSRLLLAVSGALLLGPLVGMTVRKEKGPILDAQRQVAQAEDIEKEETWKPVLIEGFRDWAKTSIGYLVRLGPIMVIAGFASGLVLQWLSPETVAKYLGNDVQGVAIAATLGILINVPLLFEIPLVALLLLLGMGTAPAATLLFTAAAGGPVTFWGIAKFMPKRAIAAFAGGTWVLGAFGGLAVLGIGQFIWDGGNTIRTISPIPAAASSPNSPSTALAAPDESGPVSIVAIEPVVGATLGGTMVTIKGTGLGLETKVTIGGLEARRAEILDIDELTDLTSMSVYTPPHATGTVDVVVAGPDGSSGTLVDVFTYQPPIFTDVGEKAGVDFLHYRDIKDIISIGAGVVIFDYNGDGNEDIYVTTSKANSSQAYGSKRYNALYRNNGDGAFTDVAMEAGVRDPSGKGNGGCAADYDNDGGQDLFVSNWGSSKLFHNNLDGTFTDVTSAAGLGDPDPTYRSMGCAWGDYDRDGFLDFVVVRHVKESEDAVVGGGMLAPQITDVRPLALYHSNMNGTFTEVTHLLGDATAPNVAGGPIGNIWGAGFQPGWVDYDNDGDPDLYVVNDFGDKLQPNVLWRNDGPSSVGGWRFVDISGPSGAGVGMFGMGLAVGDYNVDGHLDFFMTNMGDNVLLTNNGDGLTFTDTTAEAGVGVGMYRRQARASWGTVFFDYDNDGDEDLYIASGFLDLDPDQNRREQPNVLLRNNGDGSFVDVSSISGADDRGVSRGAAYADFNNDGCLDLYVSNLGKAHNVGERSRLFQNACEWGNSWLIIKTVGTTSNRDGIGARVSVTAGGHTQIREVAAGGSDESQNMLAVHFGLGKADVVDSIRIHWPSGTVQTVTNVAPNQRLTIRESS